MITRSIEDSLGSGLFSIARTLSRTKSGLSNLALSSFFTSWFFSYCFSLTGDWETLLCFGGTTAFVGDLIYWLALTGWISVVVGISLRSGYLDSFKGVRCFLIGDCFVGESTFFRESTFFGVSTFFCLASASFYCGSFEEITLYFTVMGARLATDCFFRGSTISFFSSFYSVYLTGLFWSMTKNFLLSDEMLSTRIRLVRGSINRGLWEVIVIYQSLGSLFMITDLTWSGSKGLLLTVVWLIDLLAFTDTWISPVGST